MPTKSLFGDDFVIESEKDKAKRISKKIAKPKAISAASIIKSKTTSLTEKLETIYREVDRILGVYKEDTVVIDNIVDFVNYIDAAIKNGILVIDTETNNSLDPLTCKLMGLCLYTPGQKNAYIPVNHTDLDGNRLENQITEQQIFELLSRSNEVCKNIFHNAKFDYKVIYCTCGIKLNIYWDTLIGAKLLDENERAGLKLQYIQKIDPTIEKYSIDHLFNIEYQYVDPDVFALYAATDSYMTYKLYLYQLEQFNKPGNEKIYKLLTEVEIPVLEVAADMELYGINIDTDYAERLSKKYHKKLELIDKKIEEELDRLSPLILAWRLTAEANYKPIKKNAFTSTSINNINYKYKDASWWDITNNKELSKKEAKELGLPDSPEAKSKNELLSTPIETTSPTQLAILLYDILKVPVVDKETPRGTGTEILNELANKYPIASIIVEQRTIHKMIDAFIDALPELRSPRDGRIHSNFNSMGTVTGRFSCTEPNLQQIPSRNLEIRMLFKPTPGYLFVEADYSAQEPRTTAALCQEPAMMNAFNEGKDLYAILGTKVWDNDYWDNMEHHEDGSANVDGKNRRKQMKKLLLGLSYGMGDALTAQNMGISVAEAKSIIKKFFDSYPKMKEFIDNNEISAQKLGFVEDVWGRKRRLPDAMLPDYEFSIDKFRKDFNPLLESNGDIYSDESKIFNNYLKLLLSSKSNKERQLIKETAKKNNIKIRDNGAFISRAARLSTNARILGSAATMTKKAMISIYNDKEMADLGFRLLIGVHDELIGECPIENAEKCAERLSYLMSVAMKDKIDNVKYKTDPEIEDVWYFNSYSHQVQKEYNDYINKDNLAEDIAFKKLCAEHEECLPERLKVALANAE